MTKTFASSYISFLNHRTSLCGAEINFGFSMACRNKSTTDQLCNVTSGSDLFYLQSSSIFDTVSEAVSEVLVVIDVKSLLTEIRYGTIPSNAYCGYLLNKTEGRLVCKINANVTKSPPWARLSSKIAQLSTVTKTNSS